MQKRSGKKQDINERAFSIVQQFTSQPESFEAVLESAELRRKIMREMGRQGGLKGGIARAKKLSPKMRAEIAKRAAKARWKKSK